MDTEKLILHGRLRVCKLSEEQIARILAAFEKEYNADVSFQVMEDSSLLGGFVAEINGKIIDASVKNRMKQVKPLEADGKRLEEIPVFRVYYRGTVSKSGDGIVWMKQFQGRQSGELLEFENNVLGMAMELDGDAVGAVLFSDADRVSTGSTVYGSGKVVQVPVGENLLGRVINPLGQPLDNEPLHVELQRPIERPAPAIIDRQMVNEPLDTGILMIDSIVPIGRGQRELIIGDRQTGKTQIAIDAILNQRKNGVICIYCAIGQKISSVSQIIQTLKSHNAMNNCVIVAATASDAPAMQYIAPYAACTIAEFFMEQGKDVLIVYDDLSKHAIAYRTLSLLLQRPPGREAYPGDIFYLHSRLLERSAHLSEEKGGGSITALPIVETLAGDISAYVPTNIISITDGQIFLEEDLFHAGIRPAVNVGLSVSRVGRSAQHPAMRKVSGQLRIDLAQYRELAIFSQFGSDIDALTKEKLDRGVRLTQLLKQNKQQPRVLSEQVVLLLAFKQNIFSEIPLKEMADCMQGIVAYVSERNREDMDAMDTTGEMNDDLQQRICDTLEAFKQESEVKANE